VANEHDRDVASSFAILQDTFTDELKVIKTDLAYIHANLSFLSQSIRAGSDHTFVARNNKRNQHHSRYNEQNQ
jgi:hypothetical protein